uniref:Uncharacterized protein n=1 Tax=Noctiluca scintillans TaxID=2966 RepID=A0A7S1AV31_NOCSC|mmetsp:Transcript_61446/g.163556  ORF Transcript_61446/g.163556 Transcript_61446/m.163556 type:complete len:194 (+) Transcript_61446:98-679(+)
MWRVPPHPGPPTPFALKLRPWLLVSFALLMPVAVARFLVADVVGGIFLTVTSVFGWYTLKTTMDVSWLLCLGIILFLNSIFDACILIARFRHHPKWDSWQVILLHVTILLGPLLEMMAAALCWWVFHDFASILTRDELLFLESDPQLHYGIVRNTHTEAMSHCPNVQSQHQFAPFQGESYSLDDGAITEKTSP